MNTLNEDEADFIDVPLHENEFYAPFREIITSYDIPIIKDIYTPFVVRFDDTPNTTSLEEAEQIFKQLYAYCASRGIREPCYAQHMTRYPNAYSIPIAVCRVTRDDFITHDVASDAMLEDSASDAMLEDGASDAMLEDGVSDAMLEDGI